MDALTERTNVAATMFLASSALLYVVASTLPKTSYLTTMDKFVLANMLIQFSVAIVSWLSTGVFFQLSNDAASLLNFVAFFVLLGLLFLSSAVILGVPMWKAARKDRTAWPDTLMRENESTRFYPFELFVNVFPPWQPGSKNPVQLPEKNYGTGTEPSDGPPKEKKDARASQDKEKKGADKRGSDGPRDSLLVSENL